nr:DUF2474 domain-containing protein [uncultured Gellertiella sp.]
MAAPLFARRLLWFLALWVGGVAATGFVALIIRLWLKA